MKSASSPTLRLDPSFFNECFLGTKALRSSFKNIDPPLSEIESSLNGIVLRMFEEDYKYFPTIREIRDDLING